MTEIKKQAQEPTEEQIDEIVIAQADDDSAWEAPIIVNRTKRLKSVTIFCDGSSLGNGQVSTRAAAVALLGFKGVWRAVGEYLGNATNQQAEVAAAALGLESLREPCRVHLFTDSRYVVETMGGRFRRKTNHEWWARLDKAATRHDVKWEWVRGHDGNLVQEAVDKAARKIAAAGRVDEEILRAAIDKVGTTDGLLAEESGMIETDE
jgi:ribonuclease HI